jgi:hypothetical protein
MSAAACGSLRPLSESDNAATAPQTAGPPVTAAPTVGVTTGTKYTSTKWLYSISYPAGWYDVPNNGAPDTQKYFATAPTGAPEGVGEGGMWVTVGVNEVPTAKCQVGPGWAMTQTVQLDGVTAALYGGPHSRTLYIVYKDWCYHFDFIVYTTAAWDAHRLDAYAIVSSFRFNR